MDDVAFWLRPVVRNHFDISTNNAISLYYCIKNNVRFVISPLQKCISLIF